MSALDDRRRDLRDRRADGLSDAVGSAGVVAVPPVAEVVKCASPRCKARCTTVNDLGVGDVCAAPRFYDHQDAARIDTDFDLDAENRNDRDDIHGMRELDQ